MGFGHGGKGSSAHAARRHPLVRASPRAENKRPRTIQSYTEAVRRLHDFCSANGMPLQIVNITPEHIEAFLADQLARLRPASARARFASLRQFFAWLSSRDEPGDRAPDRQGRPWRRDSMELSRGRTLEGGVRMRLETFTRATRRQPCSDRPVRPGDRTSFRAVRVRLGDRCRRDQGPAEDHRQGRLRLGRVRRLRQRLAGSALRRERRVTLPAPSAEPSMEFASPSDADQRVHFELNSRSGLALTVKCAWK